jgi:hypothetical protein
MTLQEAFRGEQARKGGGKRKRRSAYKSGRREIIGFGPSLGKQLKRDINNALGRKRQKRRVLANTGYSGKFRWKTY